MKYLQKIQQSYLPEIWILAIFICWTASLFLGIKSYYLKVAAHAADPNVPMPVFNWGHHLPGLCFLILFVGIRWGTRGRFNK